MCGFMAPGTPTFDKMFGLNTSGQFPGTDVSKSSATGFGKLLVPNKSSGPRQTDPSPRQASPSGKKGGDRRGDLLAGGGRRELAGGKNEGNLGKKTLLGG